MPLVVVYQHSSTRSSPIRRTRGHWSSASHTSSESQSSPLGSTITSVPVEIRPRTTPRKSLRRTIPSPERTASDPSPGMSAWAAATAGIARARTTLMTRMRRIGR